MQYTLYKKLLKTHQKELQNTIRSRDVQINSNIEVVPFAATVYYRHL